MSDFTNLKIETTEMHTGGEPLRIFSDRWEVEGNTILEKRRFFKDNYDHIRKFLMWEPRGHRDQYGAVIVDSSKADFGVLFMHNEGYSTFCGHAVIALTRWAVDKVIVKKSDEKETKVTIECPAGVVEAYLDNDTQSVRFLSMPAFCYKTDLPFLMGTSNIYVDIAYGGTFYAYVKAQDVGIDMDDFDVDRAKRIAAVLKDMINDTVPLVHPDPEYADVGFLYGVIFIDKAIPGKEVTSKNVCIFADNQVDRCPTGSSVTARMALFHDKGLSAVGDSMKFYCPIGKSTFTGKIVATTTCGDIEAVTVEVAGKAHYTGNCTFYAEEGDPTLPGFIV